jgi:3-methyl-2-oxobutanoate hydroxymethyltransferase
MAEERKKLTIPALKEAKKAGRKIVMASIPDYPSAVWAERAGIDICAIGDNLGMVSYGFANMLPGDGRYDDRALEAVARGAPNTFRLVAMPYGSFPNTEIAVVNALRFTKEGGIDCVKMQGGRQVSDHQGDRRCR